MAGYIAWRLVSAVPVILLVTLISFSIMSLVPGDPAAIIAGATATDAEIADLRVALGLDRPFLTRLVHWYGDLLSGDLGRSILLQRPVAEAIAERLPVTLALGAYALVLTLVFGVGLGVVAAVRQNTWVDQICMTVAVLGVSIPNLWLALLFVFLFAVTLGWFPTGGYVPFGEDAVGALVALTLPAISLALMQVGLLARMTRSAMLEVLRQDFVRTARAKGLPGWFVVLRHALGNALIPLVTVMGIILSLMISGTVVIESVFSLPGMGRLIVNAIQRRDYPVIQGGLMLIATALVLVNLVVDLLYAWLDPRVRYAD
ncbi:ABC transporter permease [Elioraea sp.]|uniref:ABC transporter permease n=1 Tax=Elioraea sp. TaxID=2185103 RepID=UPI0025C5544E|nr:ABC transporter permease [Elioraea sp.]